MAAAPFSFHCVICINSFDLLDRPPVVLPCGHTFICEPCSKRIDKCMECRTSLFVTHITSNPIPQHEVGQTNHGYTYTPRTPVSRRRTGYEHTSRYSTSPQPPQKKASIEKIPLPLPRNIVLIALMEAASKRDILYSANLMDDSSDTDNSIPNEDQVVLDSIDVLSSACGTYVVRERYGLPLHKSNSTNNLFRNAEDIMTSKPTLHLQFGQKVQIVDVHEGVYTLARNEGVMFANSSQLVKVGVAKERSCTVEGMINSIQTNKAGISQRMNDLLQTESRLRSELDYSLSQPPSNPVIEACTDMGNVELINVSQDAEMMDHHGRRHRSLPSTSDTLIPSSFASPISKPDVSSSTMFISDESFATPTSVPYPLVRQTPPSSSMSNLDSISPFSRRGIMCGGSLMPLFGRFDDDDEDDDSNHLPIQRPISDDTSAGRNFETVDFRTGFSGHVALNKARKGLASTGRSAIRMMGEHGGIGPIRRRNQTHSSSPISDKKTW